jgi:hypothetical protein
METKMNKKESNKYSMYRYVCEVLKENKNLFSGIPALITSAESFEKCFSEISEIDARLTNAAKGTSFEKQNTEDDLSDSVVKIGGILYVAGIALKNEKLKAVSSVTYTELKRMRENDFLQKAKLIFKNSEENFQTLKTMHTGIEDEIRELEQNLIEYEKAMNEKGGKSAESHAARTALDAAFEKADSILKEQLDNLVELLRAKNPDFYNAYISSRVIKDLGMRKKKEENSPQK